VLRLAPTHLGWDTRRQFTRRSRDPPGLKRRQTGFTPFKLLFGDEAITPEEAKAGSIRTTALTEDEADYHVAKDTIEGVRLQAMENINKYQAETIKWRDRKA
jgi:hypothetical protein